MEMEKKVIRPQYEVDGIVPSGREFVAARPEFAKGGMFVAENTSGAWGKGKPLAEIRLGERQPWEKTAAETPDSIQATVMKDVKEPAPIPPVGPPK